MTIGLIRETVHLRVRGIVGEPAGSLPVRQLVVPCPIFRAARWVRTLTGAVLGGVPQPKRSEPLEQRPGVTAKRTGYEAAVDLKVRTVADLIAAGQHEDGWTHGLRYIVEEMIDETIDIPAWARGRRNYEVPVKVEARILRAIDHAAEAYTELQLALRELDRT